MKRGKEKKGRVEQRLCIPIYLSIYLSLSSYNIDRKRITSISQLSAHHACIRIVPRVVTDGTPVSIDEHLHSTLAQPWTIPQTHRVGKVGVCGKQGGGFCVSQSLCKYWQLDTTYTSTTAWNNVSLGPRPKTNPSTDRFQYRAYWKRYTRWMRSGDESRTMSWYIAMNISCTIKVHFCKTSVKVTAVTVCGICKLTGEYTHSHTHTFTDHPCILPVVTVVNPPPVTRTVTEALLRTSAVDIVQPDLLMGRSTPKLFIRCHYRLCTTGFTVN